MTYRLLALDIDGTIYERITDTPLTKRTRQAISRVMDTGAGVTLATGRTYNSALQFSRDLGITLEVFREALLVTKDAIGRNAVDDVLEASLAPAIIPRPTVRPSNSG